MPVTSPWFPRAARRGALALAAAAVLAAPATADAAYRLGLNVGHDGTWAVTGETLDGAAQGRVELWRDGAVVTGGSATGEPADRTGFAQLRQDGDDTSPGPLAGVLLTAGDELRYYLAGDAADSPRVRLAYTGRPAIDAACAGATSFTAQLDPGTGAATGGADEGAGGTARTGSAALDATTATVTLDGALTEGSIAWVQATATQAGGPGEADDVHVTLRSARAVVSCAAPETPSTGTPAFGLLSGGAAPVAPPAPTPPPPAPPAPDTAAPKVDLELPRMKVRSLARDGFAFAVGCGEPCAAKATLTIDRKTARRLKLVKRKSRGSAPVTLGSGSATVGVGRGVVPVKIARRKLKRLRRAKRLKLELTVEVADAAGNAAGVRRTLTVKR